VTRHWSSVEVITFLNGGANNVHLSDIVFV
jgi:hypothetical protein